MLLPRTSFKRQQFCPFEILQTFAISSIALPSTVHSLCENLFAGSHVKPDPATSRYWEPKHHSAGSASPWLSCRPTM
jgi:hypothetical protein